LKQAIKFNDKKNAKIGVKGESAERADEYGQVKAWKESQDTLIHSIRSDLKSVKNNVKGESSTRVDGRGPTKSWKESLAETKLSQTRTVAGTREISMVEEVEKDSDSEEDVRTSSPTPENFMDLEKLACTLCKRQFPSYDILLK